MRIHIAADHAGFELREALITHLTDAGHEVIDHGNDRYDAEDDYPSFCFAAGEAVVADEGSLGIVIGGSGNGEQIAANKVPGIRCALAWNEETAQLSRQHNNANCVGIGARQHTVAAAIQIVAAFVGTAFSNADRHQRRIDQVSAYETA
ncbi:ribose-5-phosphate isomerase [Pseudactinotalea sp. HY158]|uniref:ribose-5-phosphate isomerase n=1 Tax=Pseudactinotalea sp. HY158 TaxID=2654547 RepID=UPI00129D1AE1|nr:ribose-5-phosphate isomerase [Pseudactinotalea sp. HY158]QGH70099.1 ribose-5-phosphate isomerase [Pseudactinotalea sp. HY158]